MSSFFGTVCGFLALFFWSMSIGISRSLMQKLGVFTGSSLTFLLAGSLLGFFQLRKKTSGKITFTRLRQMAGCGLLFVAYMVFLYSGVGLASSHLAVLTVALLNYLWPTFMIIFSLLFLGYQASWLIFPGLVAATSGTLVAVTATSRATWKNLFFVFTSQGLPFFFGLGAGISWGLYSVVTRRFSQNFGGLPLYLLASGLVLGIIRFFHPETSSWSWQAWSELSFMVVFPTISGYSLWELGLRHGNFVLLAGFSYFVPVLSTLISCAYLGIRPGWQIFFASLLVSAGAVLARLSLKEQPGVKS